MFQPINLLMSHFNLENSQQLNRDASIAAAQQTGQTQELAQESLRRTQIVQATDAPAESQRVHRRNDGEERDRENKRDQDKNQDKNRDTFQRHDPAEDNPDPTRPSVAAQAPDKKILAVRIPEAIPEASTPAKSFEFYV